MDAVAELFRAVGTGDAAEVRRIVEADPALARARNHARLPVRVFARYAGHAAVIDALAGAGPAPDIFESSQAGDAARIRELLAGDASLAAAYSGDGFTALHFAAFYGAAEAVRALLDGGASVAARTSNFLANQPLHAAAASGWPHVHEICALLITAGADANDAQHGGNRPIHTAAFKGDRRLAEMLLDAGADPAARNDEGKSPADLAEAQGYAELGALLWARAGG